MTPRLSHSASGPCVLQATLTKTVLSRSSPSLVTAASFNLRAFSASRKRIADDKDDPIILQKAQLTTALQEIDLIGGNGRWRQKMAEAEFERRRLEEEERKAMEQRKEAERRRRIKVAEERRRQQQQVEETARFEKEEKKRKVREEIEAERQRRETEKRLAREEAERQRIARLPKPCKTCTGSGACQCCGGSGHVYDTYLVSSMNVGPRTTQDFGRLLQGCPACGGYKQGVRGVLLKGTGKCTTCTGTGKIWPQIDDCTSPSKRFPTHRAEAVADMSTLLAGRTM
eukprot:TRINITY_DN103987_c0_g1_i1.p1 TRINITY_DN103987_c0_g1~~TRINITY_DN103987_c0_g1_i1.p1  ORF type:complete len:285 (+),score=83.58 TRINITY_DN103987_c0_g1_i1:110-964(+)